MFYNMHGISLLRHAYFNRYVAFCCSLSGYKQRSINKLSSYRTEKLILLQWRFYQRYQHSNQPILLLSSSNEIKTNDVNGSRLAEQGPSSGRCSRQGNIGRHHADPVFRKKRKWTSQENKIVMECYLLSEPKI